ncbi:MAG: hypothetical protein DHS20C18_40850 [Saprospiraceae bacterium]|nr:MAG: hypothetical protein DHS20C18_40850 [Saprospiraceae bacterium]
MQNLDVLHLVFEDGIAPWELSQFRQKFLAKWSDGRQLPGIRNAKSKHYPRFQFKVRYYFGEYRPMLLVLGQEASLLNQALDQSDTCLPFPLADRRLLQFPINESGTYRPYNLYNYQAFNPENYERYHQIKTNAGRLEMLKKLLNNHLVTLTKGIGQQAAAQIQIQQLTLKKSKQLNWQGIDFQCFDLSFYTNLFLPEYIGCGNCVSSGFGVIRQLKTQSSNESQSPLQQAS